MYMLCWIRCYSSRLIDVGFVLLSARKAVPRSQKPPPTTTPLFALSAHFSLAWCFFKYIKWVMSWDMFSTYNLSHVNVKGWSWLCSKLDQRRSLACLPLLCHSSLFFLPRELVNRDRARAKSRRCEHGYSSLMCSIRVLSWILIFVKLLNVISLILTIPRKPD